MVDVVLIYPINVIFSLLLKEKLSVHMKINAHGIQASHYNSTHFNICELALHGIRLEESFTSYDHFLTEAVAIQFVLHN